MYISAELIYKLKEDIKSTTFQTSDPFPDPLHVNQNFLTKLSMSEKLTLSDADCPSLHNTPSSITNMYPRVYIKTNFGNIPGKGLHI